MAKKIKKIVRLHIAAAQATPAPPVGPTLAQYGINIGEFCKTYNDATKTQIGVKLPVDITIYENRSYEFQVHQPPTSALIRKAASIEKGSGTPNKLKVGKITKAQLEEIARQKMPDLNTTDLERAMKIVSGTARQMGVIIIE